MNSESKWESNGFERLSKPIEQSNIIGCSFTLLSFFFFFFLLFTHWFLFLSSRLFPLGSSSHQLGRAPFNFGDNFGDEKECVIYRIRELLLQPSASDVFIWPTFQIHNSLFFCFLFSCLFLVFFFEMQFPPSRPSIPWHEDVRPFFPLLWDVYPQFFFSLYTRSPQPTFWLWLWTKKGETCQELMSFHMQIDNST